MARYTGPVCRLCRRHGEKLFLKGDRCFTPKCSFDRRPNPPGPRPARRRKVSDRGLQLREKQRARRSSQPGPSESVHICRSLLYLDLHIEDSHRNIAYCWRLEHPSPHDAGSFGRSMSGPSVAVQAQIDADTAGNETKEDISVSDPVLYVPIGTTVLSLAFTAAILQRYRQSPRSLHLLDVVATRGLGLPRG